MIDDKTFLDLLVNIFNCDCHFVVEKMWRSGILDLTTLDALVAEHKRNCPDTGEMHDLDHYRRFFRST